MYFQIFAFLLFASASLYLYFNFMLFLFSFFSTDKKDNSFKFTFQVTWKIPEDSNICILCDRSYNFLSSSVFYMNCFFIYLVISFLRQYWDLNSGTCLCLLHRLSSTWTTSPALLALVIFLIGFMLFAQGGVGLQSSYLYFPW